MARALKFWHQYGFIASIIGYLLMASMIWQARNDAIASTERAVVVIQDQHTKENVDHRVTVLEQIVADNRESLNKIESTEGKIFDRINIIAEKR